MQTFAKKSTALAFIYLVLSIPAINAARIKQATRARHEAQAKGMEALAAENGALKQQLEAMKEVMEFTSELSKLKSEAKTGYWGESWATCEQRLEDLERREHKLEQRYESGMEDGELDVLEAGRVGLKAWSVSSTLSTAGKNGCEWATSRQTNTSALDNVMKQTMSNLKCKEQTKAYLEKAQADNVDPEEAKANMLKIMFSSDCKLSADDEEETEKTFEALAQLEDDAEAGAMDVAQQFADSLQSSNGTALLQSRSSSQIFGVIGVFMYTILVLLYYILACTVVASVLVSILTMVFLALKALFLFALGQLDSFDFSAEMASIMKPFVLVLATGCTYFMSQWVTFALQFVYAVEAVAAAVATDTAAGLALGTTAVETGYVTMVGYLGLTVQMGGTAVGAVATYDELTGSNTLGLGEEPEEAK